MPGSEKTHIQITKKQHQKLQLIKGHLDREAGKELGLTQQSWTPSFADALEHLMQNYKWADGLEQRWKEDFVEADEPPDESEIGADIDWDKHA